MEGAKTNFGIIYPNRKSAFKSRLRKSYDLILFVGPYRKSGLIMHQYLHRWDMNFFYT
jgi:hypothetical protein